MAIYEPVFDGTGVYSSGIGKDSPYGKQTGLFKPQLYRGAGRFGPIVSGAKYIGRYFRKNPRFGARIGAVAGGAAVRYASSNQQRKALRSSQSVNYRKRFRHKYQTRRRNRCGCRHVCC